MTSKLTDRPALVLLSGLLCDAEIWEDLRGALAALADVEVFSFPGFSSIAKMAEHVLASAPPRFALAGHSMGGRVALEIVRTDPSRVAGLALLNTGVHAPAALEPQSRGRLLSIARNEGMSALAAEWLPPMLDRERSPDDALLARLTRMVERSSPESFAAQIQALLNRPDAREVLPTVRVPVLLMSASGDTWSPPAQHAAMRELCPHAELVIINNAGHMSPIEQPKPVTAALTEWLNRVNDGATGNRATSLEKLLIREACAAQIHRFARFNDAGAWEALGDLFTDDGIFNRPSNPNEAIRGRDDILASFKSRPGRLTRHLVSNIEVTVESSSRARAVSTVVLHVAESSDAIATITSTSVGHFEDRFMKVGEEWLFAERRGKIIMQSPTQSV